MFLEFVTFCSKHSDEINETNFKTKTRKFITKLKFSIHEVTIVQNSEFSLQKNKSRLAILDSRRESRIKQSNRNIKFEIINNDDFYYVL